MTSLTKQCLDQPSTIILGAGGHACVVADALITSHCNVIGFTDNAVPVGQVVFDDIHVLGTDDIILEQKSEDIMLAMGLGFLPGNNLRYELFKKVKAWGYKFRTIIHASAVIGKQVTINEGTQIMAGVTIQPNVKIGSNVIVNTAANIDHDTIIGDHCHIAPGSTICGDVSIGDKCFIGAGATIIQGVDIGDNVIVPAGETVRKNILSDWV